MPLMFSLFEEFPGECPGARLPGCAGHAPAHERRSSAGWFAECEPWAAVQAALAIMNGGIHVRLLFDHSASEVGEITGG
jgi:hypothetical protein